MLNALPQLFASAAMQRACLLVNHVLSSEPVATDRLKPHAGRQLLVQLSGWPELLPAPPALRFAITPAGLLEWLPEAAPAAADLELTVEAANPARLLVQGLLGRRPPVAVAGDSRLAADVSWVIDNLRWDVRDDLARIFGELPARELARSARALAEGLRSAVQGFAQRAASGTGGSADAPAQPPAR